MEFSIRRSLYPFLRSLVPVSNITFLQVVYSLPLVLAACLASMPGYISHPSGATIGVCSIRLSGCHAVFSLLLCQPASIEQQHSFLACCLPPSRTPHIITTPHDLNTVSFLGVITSPYSSILNLPPALPILSPSVAPYFTLRCLAVRARSSTVSFELPVARRGAPKAFAVSRGESVVGRPMSHQPRSLGGVSACHSHDDCALRQSPDMRRRTSLEYIGEVRTSA